MSILNYASMERDDIVAELLTLQGEHGRLKSKYEVQSCEGTIMRRALLDIRNYFEQCSREGDKEYQAVIVANDALERVSEEHNNLTDVEHNNLKMVADSASEERDPK